MFLEITPISIDQVDQSMGRRVACYVYRDIQYLAQVCGITLLGRVNYIKNTLSVFLIIGHRFEWRYRNYLWKSGAHRRSSN